MSFSTYSEALKWLYSTQSSGIKLGLKNIRRLIDELGIAKADRKYIHVAGTNGKGSTCAMIDAMCRCAGIRTGLFTSPHLLCFRERIRVDGEMIAEDSVVEGLSRIRALIERWEEIHPTFFEITTALSLDYFDRSNAELVVLETGLGGRLDATNAVTPIVAVLTPIAFDHQEWLGNTLERIASEKAGIIKPGIPVVSSTQEPVVERILREKASCLDAPIEFVRSSFTRSKINLIGKHQKQNAALAIRALQQAGLSVNEAAVQQGLSSVAWAGRFQCINERFILDGAHNAAAVANLIRTWQDEFPDEKATLILGFLADKDPRSLCRLLLPIASRVVVVPVSSQRACSPERIRDIIIESSAIPCTIAKSVKEALALTTPNTGRILITGSLFLVGEALSILLGGNEPPHETNQ